MRDIWQEKQRNKLFGVENFVLWFIVSNSLNYLFVLSMQISYTLVTDVGDTIAIFDCYPILLPFFGLCIRHARDWKHRYILCFTLIIASVILISEPDFIFTNEDDSDSDSSDDSSSSDNDQFIGILLALVASFGVGLSTVATTLLKKLAYYDYLTNKQVKTQNEKQNRDKNDREDNPNKVKENENENANEDKKDNNDHDGIPMSDLTPLMGGNHDHGVSNNSINNNNNNNEIDEFALKEIKEMIEMISIEDIAVTEQSNEFIIQNDRALTVFYLEYGSLIIIGYCLLFSVFAAVPNNSIASTFTLYNTDGYSSDAPGYILLTGILFAIDRSLFCFAILKTPYAPLVGVLDISDVVFTYILSYVWLNQEPTYYGLVGAILVVCAIFIGVYPWQKHDFMPNKF